jgi:hypothetical protein
MCLAPLGSTYGYDVLVHIGWLRQHQRATYSEIHLTLSARLAISEAHVRYLVWLKYSADSTLLIFVRLVVRCVDPEQCHQPEEPP